MNSQEAKAPIGLGKYNVQNKIQEAARHSCNIVIDLALDGQFDDRILEWMGNHQNLAEFRREMTMRRGPRRRVLANGIFREDSDWRSRVL